MTGAAPAGVFVLGMHRSGTSAMARVVNLLGVPLCVEDDLMLHYGDNPTGHWESRSLMNFNEKLFHRLGAAWDCPPPAEEGLGGRPLPDPAEARRLFAAVHVSEQWAWKDPRLCILLPYWRQVLSGTHIHVLMMRHPTEVAASLGRRDQLQPRHAFAMWERYVRHALVACEGQAVLVIEYSEFTSATVPTCAKVERFLARFGLETADSSTEASAFVQTNLRHHVHPQESVEGLSDRQTELLALVRTLNGAHDSFPALELFPETPDLTGFLGPRRSYWGWRPADAENGAADPPDAVAPYPWEARPGIVVS